MQKKQELIFCECGCGQQLLKYDKSWRERKRILGHNTKGYHHTEETKQKIR